MILTLTEIFKKYGFKIISSHLQATILLFLYFIIFLEGARNGPQCREPPMCCYSCYPCHQWTLKYISHQNLTFSTFYLGQFDDFEIILGNDRFCCWFTILIIPNICHGSSGKLTWQFVSLRAQGV